MKRKKKNRRKVNGKKKELRKGSRRIKKELLQENPYCDICGSAGNLEIHHVYLIRHGFPTKKENCRLLCQKCHRAFHHRWDKYLDITFGERPTSDFNQIYETLKRI